MYVLKFLFEYAFGENSRFNGTNRVYLDKISY